MRLARFLAVLAAVSQFSAAEDVRKATHFRRPVAAVRLGEEMLVANRRSGTISVLTNGRVASEFAVAKTLSDLVRVDDSDELLVTDEAAHVLVVFERSKDGWSVARRIPVAKYPRSAAVDGRLAAVSSSWSRRVTLVDLDDPNGKPATIDLPFLGGHVVSTPAGFVVAAAGEGRLAIVGGENPRVLRTFELPGHNVGGLFFDETRRELLVTQQVLKDDTSTTYENVFWGGVLKNVLQSIPLDEIAGRETRDDAPPDLAFLGFPSDAAGDPADVVVTSRGRTVVSIGGVDAVHLRDGPKDGFEALAAGRRPAGIVLSEDERTAYVCNTYDDSITLLDLEKREQAGTIPLGPAPEPTLVDRGESLFHDARISLDGWYSCHSCHTHGHSSGQRTDNLGDGYFGDPKRTPSLLGTRGTEPWAWNGSSKSLAAQVEKSILKTMRGEAAPPDDVRALVAYMETLEPPPSLAEARGDLDEALAARGRKVFESRGCVECHAGERLTTPHTYDVGLRDRNGATEFNPPSLRGVSQRSSFLHDGRAKNLRELFEKHRHPNDSAMTAEELEALLEYLRGL